MYMFLSAKIFGNFYRVAWGQVFSFLLMTILVGGFVAVKCYGRLKISKQ